MFDLVLQSGKVVDGSGGPWYRADIGIKDGRIARIGHIDVDSAAVETWDVSGSVVCPGLIDIHRHSDFTLLVHPPADSALLQGITTEVIGNCGFGPAPALQPTLAPSNILFYRPDLGVEVSWQSFSEYLDVLDSPDLGVNVASLVSHGAIRISVMGYRPDPASDYQLDAMKELLEDSLKGGAFGMSSGLEYTPGNSSTPAELVELARVIADHGGIYATHVRDRWLGIVDAGREAIDVAKRTGVPVHQSHITARRLAAPDNPTLLRDVELAREQGYDVTFDTYPYERGIGTMTEVLPPWALEGTPAQVLDRLRDPEERKRIESYPKSANIWPLLGKWDYITITVAPSSPEVIGKTLAEIAEERGEDPWDVVFGLFLAEGENFASVSAVATTMDASSIWETVKHELCSLGSDSATQGGPLADALLHSGGSYGFTAKVFDEYVHTGKLSLEAAIHKLTGLPAARIGFRDRGLIAEGMVADLVVLDPSKVHDRTSYLEPNVSPSGFRHVLLGGRPAVRNGHLTDLRLGSVLRAHR